VTRRKTALIATLVCALLSLTEPLSAQGRLSQMRDPGDGAFDLSAWLATSAGFLPILMPVTEPAVGYGGALGLTFFHRPAGWDIDEARAAFAARERMTPPSSSAAFGMYTSNDSWAAGGGHRGIWGGGRWRYTGGGGFARFNLSVAGDAPTGEEILFDYELEGWRLTQSIRYKVGSTDFYVGALYNLTKMSTRFTAEGLPGVDPAETDSGLGSAGLALGYDSRSNTFTPDRGVFVNVEGKRQDTALGGDFDYWSGKGTLLAYFDPGDLAVVGLRAEAATAGDDAPFWARPSVNLRGIAKGRYAGDQAGVFESEVRLDVHRRWSLVVFGGAGWTFSDTEGTDELGWIGGGGTGARYLLARAFGLRGGADVAYGKDGWAFYVTMGSAWGGF